MTFEQDRRRISFTAPRKSWLSKTFVSILGTSRHPRQRTGPCQCRIKAMHRGGRLFGRIKIFLTRCAFTKEMHAVEAGWRLSARNARILSTLATPMAELPGCQWWSKKICTSTSSLQRVTVAGPTGCTSCCWYHRPGTPLQGVVRRNVLSFSTLHSGGQ